jgi:hypothetical protein
VIFLQKRLAQSKYLPYLCRLETTEIAQAKIAESYCSPAFAALFEVKENGNKDRRKKSLNARKSQQICSKPMRNKSHRCFYFATATASSHQLHDSSHLLHDSSPTARHLHPRFLPQQQLQ